MVMVGSWLWNDDDSSWRVMMMALPPSPSGVSFLPAAGWWMVLNSGEEWLCDGLVPHDELIVMTLVKWLDVTC